MASSDDRITLGYELLHEGAKPPSRATEGSGAFDLYAIEDGVIGAKMTAIRTGLALAIPPGYSGVIYARSGLALKYGIVVGAGFIDSDYRGEVKVLAHCVGGCEDPHQGGRFWCEGGEYRYAFKAGERIAQIAIVRDPRVTLREETGIKDSITSHSGFGSTGQF